MAGIKKTNCVATAKPNVIAPQATMSNAMFVVHLAFLTGGGELLEILSEKEMDKNLLEFSDSTGIFICITFIPASKTPQDKEKYRLDANGTSQLPSRTRPFLVEPVQKGQLPKSFTTPIPKSDCIVPH